MKNVKISVIIKSNFDISAINSLLRQNVDQWECFIINNNIKNINSYIADDSRFHIIDDNTNPNIVYDTIKKANGEYILLISADDILMSNAIYYILHIINFTNADIIKFNSSPLSESVPDTSNKVYRFKYIFNKGNLLEYIFSNISEFCFKKEIITNPIQSEHAFLINAVTNAKDVAMTKDTCIMRQQQYNLSVSDVIENYEYNHVKLQKDFWKQYFQYVTPQIIKQTIVDNDKKSFINFCRKIPLELIPLRYRIMCYMLMKSGE